LSNSLRAGEPNTTPLQRMEHLQFTNKIFHACMVRHVVLVSELISQLPYRIDVMRRNQLVQFIQGTMGNARLVMGHLSDLAVRVIGGARSVPYRIYLAVYPPSQRGPSNSHGSELNIRTSTESTTKLHPISASSSQYTRTWAKEYRIKKRDVHNSVDPITIPLPHRTEFGLPSYVPYLEGYRALANFPVVEGNCWYDVL
jgi:hypothetical protein